MTDEQRNEILSGIEIKLVEDTRQLERSRNSADMHKLYLEMLKTIPPEILTTDNANEVKEFEDLIVLNNFHAFTLFSLLDLYATIKILLSAKTDWERIYAIKHGYLIIYEALDTYYRHNTLLKQLLKGKYSSMAEAYKPVANEIKSFGHKHGYPTKMNSIRNSIIAHIETDFAKYFDTIKSLNGEEGMAAVLSFTTVLKHLQEFLHSFVLDANNMTQINAQWKKENLEKEQRFTTLLQNIEDMTAKIPENSTEAISLKKKMQDFVAQVKNLK